jgi:hypothetical protein
MIAVFPVRTFSPFPLVVFLGGSPCRQLNALGDDRSPIPVINEEMSVIRGTHVIEDDRPIALLRLKEPIEPALSVFAKFQQEFLLMATVGSVPCMTGQVMSTGSWYTVLIPPVSRMFS